MLWNFLISGSSRSKFFQLTFINLLKTIKEFNLFKSSFAIYRNTNFISTFEQQNNEKLKWRQIFSTIKDAVESSVFATLIIRSTTWKSISSLLTQESHEHVWHRIFLFLKGILGCFVTVTHRIMIVKVIIW